MKKLGTAAFVLFLLFGVAGFFIVAARIHIPVYTTLSGQVKGENEIVCGDDIPLPQNDSPVFVYESRESNRKKADSCQLNGNKIVFRENSGYPVGTKVNIDIRTDEVTLLYSIFCRGGSA